MPPALLAALKVLIEVEHAGDWVYEVRERALGDDEWLEANPDTSTWEHPRVKAYSNAITTITNAIKEAEGQ